MTHRRRRIALTTVALCLVATGCASTPHNGGTDSLPAKVAPFSTPTATVSHNPCGKPHLGALSTFNRDGSPRWSIEYPVGEEESQAAPIADHDVIFIGHSGSASAVRVADGSTVWDDQLGTDVFTLWLIAGTLVANVDQVSDHAKIVGLDPATGAQRWTYTVPGDGFLGDAVVTDDGGLVFREAQAGKMTALDTSNGSVRWSRDLGDPRSSGDLPSVAPGLVLYVDAEGEIYALDARTGAVRWHAPGGLTGPELTGGVIVSDNVGVVVPDAVADSMPIVAHSLDNGAEVWRRRLADIADVFADQAGFLLMDYRADTVTLVRATSAAQIWQAQLHKIEILNEAPVTVQPANALAIFERDSVAFVDRDTGDVERVSASASVGHGTAGDDGLFLGTGTELQFLSPTAIVWTEQLLHFTQLDPAALDDGGVAVQSEDPMCASF
jgi:outer membrane protein assembly factor BamB